MDRPRADCTTLYTLRGRAHAVPETDVNDDKEETSDRVTLGPADHTTYIQDIRRETPCIKLHSAS